MTKEYREWFCYVMFAVVLFLAEFYFTPVFSLLFLISPLPFMLLQYRFGTHAAMCAAFISLLSIWLPDVFEQGFSAACSATNLIYLLMFMLLFVFTGMLFGTLAHTQRSATDWLLKAITASVVAKILLMVTIITSTGINPFALDEALASQIVSAVSQAANLGSAQNVKAYVTELCATMKLLLPSLLIFYATADAFCSYKAAQKLLKRKGVTLAAFKPFGAWRFPKELSAAIIAALLFQVAVKFMPYYGLKMVCENLIMVLRAIFTLQGMSVCWCLMGKNKILKALRLSIFVFSILLFALFSYPYSFIGIIDIWYDLRKIGGKKDEGNSETGR